LRRNKRTRGGIPNLERGAKRRATDYQEKADEVLKKAREIEAKEEKMIPLIGQFKSLQKAVQIFIASEKDRTLWPITRVDHF
jgi:hypothetical protein